MTKAVRKACVEALRGETITCTPKAAGEWLEWKTGRKVSRKAVTNWLQCGKLPSAQPKVMAGGILIPGNL